MPNVFLYIFVCPMGWYGAIFPHRDTMGKHVVDGADRDEDMIYLLMGTHCPYLNPNILWLNF
jgi:hypothetical protein